MEQLHPKAVWLFFFQSLLGFAILVFFFGPFLVIPWIAILGSPETLPFFPSEWLLAPAFLFGAIFCYIGFCYFWAKLTYRNWRYQLTENAIKIEKGVIWKKYISIPYERVQNVDIYRGVFARILGLSDLQIQTAGYSVSGKYGSGTEGRLPGLDPQKAEQLREELVRRIRGKDQGL